MKLTPKQARFVDEYLIDLNAAAAARRAGYSERTARQAGAENLTKPYIRAEIERRNAKISEKLEVTRERVLQELAAVGFADLEQSERVTAASKVAALDKLARHLRMYGEMPEDPPRRMEIGWIDGDDETATSLQ